MGGKLSVLVVGGGSRAALAIVKSLGKKGIPVDAVDWDPNALVFASRYVHHKYVCVSPYFSKTGFVENIISIVQKSSYQLVIPTVDETYLPISEARQEFPTQAFFLFPPQESIEIAFDKIKTAALAEEEGISVSQIWGLDTISDASVVSSQIDFPVVVKARQSVIWHNDKGLRYKTGFAFSKEELQTKLTEFSDIGNRYLVQEYVEGVTVGFSCLSRNGETLLSFQYERVRDANPVGSGSSLRKSVAIDPVLAESVYRVIKRLSWSGLLMFEFRRTLQGEYFLIEINGRPWGAMQLAISSGVDFPYWLYRAVQGKVEPPREYKIPLLCRWLIGDLWHLYYVMTGPPVGWKLPYPSRLNTILMLLKPNRGPIRYDHICLDDPKPFFRELYVWFMTMIKRASSRLRA